MGSSIFSRIIAGDIPCYKVYENDHVIAFLDIHPISVGHTLVVPKKEVDQLWDLPDQDYKELMLATRLVAKMLKERLGVARVGVQVIGVDVPHAHVHLIPFNRVEEYRNIPDMDAEPDHEKLEELCNELKI